MTTALPNGGNTCAATSCNSAAWPLSNRALPRAFIIRRLHRAVCAAIAPNARDRDRHDELAAYIVTAYFGTRVIAKFKGYGKQA